MGRHNAELPAEFARFRVDARVPRSDWPDDSGASVLHVDMDAFFAAVELLQSPELSQQPVIVAGAGARAVVLSANYPARRYGVHSAMPVATARRLCPTAVRLPPDRSSYRKVSHAVMAQFRDITPLVEPLSLDEAFLDVSGSLRRLDSSPADLGGRIRADVVAAHDITCSVGVAPVKFVAKLASGMAKPDGMMVVPAQQLLSFLHPLPVSALSGVGGRTAEHCTRIGLETIGDVARAPLARLRRALGTAAGERLHMLAQGHDDSEVVPDRPEKSLGSERTFAVDETDGARLRRELLKLCEHTGEALRAKHVRARTVSIKVRFAGFHTITRARTLAAPTDVANEIYTVAEQLFTEYGATSRVRLIGVRVEGLTGSDAGQQLSLDTAPGRRRDVEVAADDARNRFGAGAIRPASLLEGEAESGA